MGRPPSVNLRGVIIYVARSRYFCNHGVNTAQSLKFWAIEGRVAGALNSSADKGQSAAELANATVERMHFCHGQPGGVFSGHETIGGAKNATFCAIFTLKKHFYQDRLRTNIGKALNKEWRFSYIHRD